MPHPTKPDFLLLRYFDTVYLIPGAELRAEWQITEASELAEVGLTAKELMLRTRNSPFLDGLSFAGAYAALDDAADVHGPTDGRSAEG